MGNNNCTCCCAHGNAQPNKQPEHTGFLKDYGRILLSAALLFSGIIMKATGMGFFADDTVMFAWYLAAYLPVGLPVLKEAWESILQKDIFSEFTKISAVILSIRASRIKPRWSVDLYLHSCPKGEEECCCHTEHL